MNLLKVVIQAGVNYIFQYLSASFVPSQMLLLEYFVKNIQYTSRVKFQLQSTQAIIGLLQPLEPTSYLFVQVTKDSITHLPTSEVFDSVFTIVNRSSKYVTFVPCIATCRAPDLARMFSDHIVCKFGMPQKVVSDRDSRFLSKLWQALMHLLQCIFWMSSGYHPQTDGQLEHFYGSVKQMFHCYGTASQ